MQQTVLIIDDEKKLCGLLARIIELEGYKALQAYTGKEGLKILAERKRTGCTKRCKAARH